MAIEDSPSPLLHAIFVGSSIGTHLAMAVSIHDTIRTVKAKIMAEHVLCFKDFGEISIQAIKVKRRGFFYNLADSMPVLNAFDGVKGSWFLCIDVIVMCPVKNQEIISNKVTNAHIEQHFHEGVVVSSSEPGKTSCKNGRESHISIFKDLDNDHRLDMLIDQEKDTEKKRRKMAKNDLHGQHFEGHSRGVKFIRSENIYESNKLVNILPQIKYDEIKINFVTSSEGLQSKLPHDGTILLQNPSLKNQTKKRKNKSSKSPEEAHFVVPSENILTQSARVKMYPHISGKEANTSIFLANIDGALPNHGRDIRTAFDTASLFGVANQNEKVAPPIETCMGVISLVSKEPVEDQIFQVNPEDLREKHVSLAEGISGDDRPQVCEDARISPQVTSGFQIQLPSCTDRLMSQSCQVLEPMEANDQQSRPLKQFDSKVLAKSRSRKKRSKQDSYRPCKSTKINGNQEHFNSESTQVSLNDGQSVFIGAKCIKQADQKANGDHFMGTMIEIFSSSNKVSNQDRVFDVNLNNSLNDIPCNLSELSNLFVEQDLEIGTPSLPAFEDQGKSHCSRKKSKSEQSEYPEISDAVLLKSNGEVTKSDEGRESDPSNLSNGPNQTIELLHTDAKMSVPLYDEDPLKQARIPKLNEMGVLSLPASKDQAKPRCSRKKPMKEQYKLKYSEISDVVLPKSNSEVAESNKRRELEPSNLSNGHNQKIEQLHLDAKMAIPLSDEDPLKLPRIPRLKKIRATLPASIDQAKPHHSRKNSMNERSKLKSPEISGVVLPKSSGVVIESIEEKESDPSKLSNGPSQKIGQHCVDAMMSAPLFDEDSLKQIKIPQLKERGVPSLPFFKDQAKPRCSKKKAMNEQSKFKSPEISDLVLPKFNGKVNESNEGRGSDPSSFANGSNQNQEQHQSDAKYSVPRLDEDQAKPLYSSISFMSERSKLESPEIRVLVLPKSNSEVIETNEERGSDPSNFANWPNQKIEEHYGEVKNSVPLFDEDPLKLAKNPQLNLLDPCEDSDVPKLIKEGYATTHIFSYGVSTGANMYNSDKNKSEKKVLRVSSEVSGHLELCKNDNTNLNLNNDSIPEQVKPPEKDTSHHNLEKKHVSKNSGDMETKKEEVIDASNDESVQYNELYSSTRNNIVCSAAGLNNFDFSQNHGLTNQAESSESTEDTPHHLRRFRVVKKIPIRRHKRITNKSNSNILISGSSGWIHSTTSSACSDRHLREMQQDQCVDENN